jgi:hypothetical protein
MHVPLLTVDPTNMSKYNAVIEVAQYEARMAVVFHDIWYFHKNGIHLLMENSIKQLSIILREHLSVPLLFCRCKKTVQLYIHSPIHIITIPIIATTPTMTA